MLVTYFKMIYSELFHMRARGACPAWENIASSQQHLHAHVQEILPGGLEGYGHCYMHWLNLSKFHHIKSSEIPDRF